ncbi:hypothetical protein TrST_g8201 [Triparma strigata]|uniref:Uncharacterized protein n=1 Tax=Triparma strigata TaxID=1606541 RepID=A0A9W7BZR0_9STRA|nr:hypothetical protein TrST_g8201 [Triparma strigata]
MNTLLSDTRKDAPWKNDPHFWLDLLGRNKPKTTSPSKPLPGLLGEKVRQRVIEDGYYRQPAPEKASVTSVEALREIVEKLVELGFPPSFALLYDEAYTVWAKYALPSSFKNLTPTFDILAFHVDPRKDSSGFSPHRDRQPEDVSASFDSEKQPSYLTRWISLSKACSESNSCLYVIPLQTDPGYYTSDDVTSSSQLSHDGGLNPSILPLLAALPTKESFQNIRALPCEPGESILFSHRVIHWGSKGNPETCTEPRVALSVVYSDPEFEKPYIKQEVYSWSPTDPEFPSFKVRLVLVCCQMLVYYQRFDLTAEDVRKCYDVVVESGDVLEDEYRKKVCVEFCKAVRETGGIGADGDSEAEDSDEERMLEEMLDNQDAFEDEFDDFDDYEDGDDVGGELDEDDNGEEEELGLVGKPKRRKLGAAKC